MAYMDQKKKAKIAEALKLVVPASWKWTLGVRHHSTIVFTVYSAPIDLCALSRGPQAEQAPGRYHVDVNTHHLESGFATPELRETFKKIKTALDTDNHNRSDISTDYHDVGHYVDINIGRWDRNFVCTGSEALAPV